MNTEARHPQIEPLTEREQDVLKLLVEGKSNREIAEELVLSMNTVKWYNRQIYGKLGVENREGLAERAGELGLVETEEQDERPTYNLPRPTTPLLGRERELEELEDLLLNDQSRIVSIIGPGGMGKTRLAIELANRLNGRFPDGAAFVPLAPLQSEEGIVPAIAQSLRFTFQGGGLEEKTQLLNFLREKKLFIVLDNYEHLIDSATRLIEFTEAAPGLKFAVTSREKLKLRIEQLYPLQSLPLIGWNTTTQANEDPAVKLFLEYGRRVRPTFELKTEDLDALRQILRLVDGMPLAIILASAWLELLAPEEIAEEIQKGIDFLEADYQDLPGRQRSMRVVFDASWQQLNEAQRKVFSALSVFRGGFTLDAARKVSDATPGVLLGLASHSLLNRDGNGRFEIHELLRQFAAERLSHSQSHEFTVREQHAVYYLAFLQQSESDLKGPNPEEVYEIIETEIKNIHIAWDWAVSNNNFVPLGQAGFSLERFYVRFNLKKTGVELFDRTTTYLRGHIENNKSVAPEILISQIRLLAYQCNLHLTFINLTLAEAAGREAMNLLQRPELKSIDYRSEEILILRVLGWLFMTQDRLDEGMALVESRVSLLEGLEEPREMADIYHLKGAFALKQSNIRQAVDYHRQALKLYEAVGDRKSCIDIQNIIGYGLGALGQFDESEKMLRDGIGYYKQIKDDFSLSNTITLLSETIISIGDFLEARKLIEQAIRINKRLGIENPSHYFKWGWTMFQLGEYQAVTNVLPAWLKIAKSNTQIMHIGMLKFPLGCSYLGLGEIETGKEQLEESVNLLRKLGANDYLCYCLPALGCSYILEGRLEEAASILLEAITFAKEQEIITLLAPMIASAALFNLVKGKPTQAVELYSLAELNPYVANSRWFMDLIGGPIRDSTADFPPETISIAKEQGRGMNWWETAERFIEETRQTG